MTLTVTKRKIFISTGRKEVSAEVSFSGSYPHGGEKLTAKMVDMYLIDNAFPLPKDGYIFEYDHENEKLRAYYVDYDQKSRFLQGQAPMREVKNGTDLSKLQNVRIVVNGA